MSNIFEIMLCVLLSENNLRTNILHVVTRQFDFVSKLCACHENVDFRQQTKSIVERPGAGLFPYCMCCELSVLFLQNNSKCVYECLSFGKSVGPIEKLIIFCNKCCLIGHTCSYTKKQRHVL